MASNWWGNTGDKGAQDTLFDWLATVPGTPAAQNGYDRLERLYKVNQQPGNYTYEDLERALDRGTSRSWRDSPSGQGFVNDWLARRQGAVAASSNAASTRNSNPTPLDIDPKRGTGEYDDIIDSLRDELGTAQQTIADIQNRQVSTPQTPSVQDQLSEVLAQLQIDFESRYSGLQDMMLQQQQSYENSMRMFQQQSLAAQQAAQAQQQQMQEQMQQQMAMFQQQSQAAQAAYQQQLQLSQNMAKAYVPPAEQTATTAALGDQREMETRQQQDNVLSELSILSGLGTSSNPLSGLQLA